MSKTPFKTQLRTAVAYHGLSLGTSVIAHQDDALWPISRQYRHMTFTQSLTYFRPANHHFSRIQNMAAYILSFPEDHPVRNEILRQIEAIQSDHPFIDVNDDYYLSLGRIFHEARKRFEGAGLARLTVNPSGFWQTLSYKKYAPFVCNGYGSFALLCGVTVATFAGNPLGWISSAGFAATHLLYTLLDPRAKQAYYRLYQLDKANQQRLTADEYDAKEEEKEDEADENTALNTPPPLDSTTTSSTPLTTHQRWMFESYPSHEDSLVPSLGKDITELMLYLFQPCSRDGVDWSAVLIYRILDNLIHYYQNPTSLSDKEEAICAFFAMDLTNWDEKKHTPFTFLHAIQNKPAYVAKFLDFIKSFQPHRYLELLAILMRLPSLATEIKSEATGIFATQLREHPAETIFLHLKEAKKGIAPSLAEMDEWIKALPMVIKRQIWWDLLTHPTSDVTEWITSPKISSMAKKTFQEWIPLYLAYHPKVSEEMAAIPVPHEALYRDTNLIRLLFLNEQPECNRSLRSYCYALHSEKNKYKKRVIEHIDTLSAIHQVRAYTDINDGDTQLSLFFNDKFPFGFGTSESNQDSLRDVPWKLKKAMEECVPLFQEEYPLSPIIAQILEDKNTKKHGGFFNTSDYTANENSESAPFPGL